MGKPIALNSYGHDARLLSRVSHRPVFARDGCMQVRRGTVPIKRPQFGNIVADRSEEDQIRLKAQLPREKFWIFG